MALNDLLAVTPEVYPIRAVPQIPEDFPYDKVYEGKPYPWRGGKGSVPIYEVDGRESGAYGGNTKLFSNYYRKGEYGV